MPKRYPPWVIKNMVGFLKLKLRGQFKSLSFENEIKEYGVDLSYDYPRLYLFASTDRALGASIRYKLGLNEYIEIEIVHRDNDPIAKRLLIILVVKSYPDFNLVINSMQQLICDYLNDPNKLNCAPSSMQTWIPFWSKGNDTLPDHSLRSIEKEVGNNLSPELYSSYLDKNESNNLNPDNNKPHEEIDDGSANYNNIQDPYLSITQQPRPLHEETAAEAKERKYKIVSDINKIWVLLSNKTYAGANKPTVNNKLGGILVAQQMPLKILWLKYDFAKIHAHLLSLGLQASEFEIASVETQPSIHSSSAEFDTSVRSTPKRKKSAEKTEAAKKSAMLSVPPSLPFVLHLSPTLSQTLEDAEGVVEDLSTTAKNTLPIDAQKKGNHSRDEKEQKKNPKRRREDEQHKTDLATPIPVPLLPPHKSSVILYGNTPATLPIKPPAPLALPSVPNVNSAQNLKTVAPANPKLPQIKQQPAAAKPKAPPIKQQPAAAKPKAPPINPPTPAANLSPPREESHSLVARLAKKALNPRAVTAKAADAQIEPSTPSNPISSQTQTVSAAKAAPIKPAIKKAVPAAAIAAKQAAKGKERVQIKIDLEQATAPSTGNPRVPSPFGK